MRNSNTEGDSASDAFVSNRNSARIWTVETPGFELAQLYVADDAISEVLVQTHVVTTLGIQTHTSRAGIMFRFLVGGVEEEPGLAPPSPPTTNSNHRQVVARLGPGEGLDRGAEGLVADSGGLAELVPETPPVLL